MQNRKQGIFIGLIGLPCVGKSTLAISLVEQLGASVFIEPGEEEWDYDHSRDWKEQVGRIENWVCDSNARKFREARRLANEGHKAVADAGIFLVNKALINAPSTQWWYGYMNQQEKSQLHALAASLITVRMNCSSYLLITSNYIIVSAGLHTLCKTASAVYII